MTIVRRSSQRLSKSTANPGDRPVGAAGMTANENAVASAFQNAVGALQNAVNIAQVEAALRAANPSRLIESMPWEVFGDRMATTRLAMLAQVNSSGRAEARVLGDVVGHLAFDVTDPNAVAWSATRSGRLVVEIGDTLRAEIREVITGAFVEQYTPQQAAGMLERKIGLHSRWANAVERRYQQDLVRLVSGGMNPLAAERRATELADKYRARLIRARARNIARTEIMTASNQGRYLAWQQAGDRGLVDLAIAEKEWVATTASLSGIACSVCLPVDGERVPVNDSFSNGSFLPPQHPSCRCTVLLRPNRARRPQSLSTSRA